MIQISSKYFCAGVVFKDGVVVQAAPILNYMLGWDRPSVLRYAYARGWRVRVYS